MRPEEEQCGYEDAQDVRGENCDEETEQGAEGCVLGEGFKQAGERWSERGEKGVVDFENGGGSGMLGFW